MLRTTESMVVSAFAARFRWSCRSIHPRGVISPMRDDGVVEIACKTSRR